MPQIIDHIDMSTLDPNELIVGTNGQTLAEAAAAEAKSLTNAQIATLIDRPPPGVDPAFVASAVRRTRSPDDAIAQAAREQCAAMISTRDGASAGTAPRRIGDGGEVHCGDLMGPHNGVRLCGACSTASPDERTIPCGDLIERVPTALAEELASMPPEDRAVAQRVADLAEIDPAPGWEERAVERAKREGVL